MTDRLDKLDAFRILREEIKKYGSQRNFANAHDLREQDVSDVLNSRRPISPRLLTVIGLRRVEYFERANA
ncbi:hypothetical protein K2X14_11495 [Acetobacter sp. TBRC 12305]|uniref:Uncharacterized protein n=1 Tax=Acetobacter garciniae TaxID=2817435 RepID=A0A939HQ60_9PROT|nr:hypothetical protein [Acetobacter garciniae]MBO1325366.1 hypothetical protein [Acetobacter garciniae]MBX0345462.1 hypothetical protein [Acetobacter garciniae]